MIDFNNLTISDIIAEKEWTRVYFESPGDKWENYPDAVGSEYCVAWDLNGWLETWVGPIIEVDDGFGVCDIIDASELLTDEEIDELIKMAERAVQ